ncbi:amino acid ABC transporter substrate-binding protein [Ancylobacter sp. G4_0304]
MRERARDVMKRLALCAGVTAVLAVTTAGAMAQSSLPAPGPTVEAIKKRGELICGVDAGIPGFAFQDSAGKWKGFDVAYCRAIAAAVLGDPEKVKYVGLTAKVRFTVLQAGEIDVLIRDSTLTFSRDVQLGLTEVAINFYAGQGFMVRKSLGVKEASELNGATLCMVTGATLELNIADYARAKGVTINSLLFEKTEEAFAAAEAGRCDGYTDDTGSLAAARSTMKMPDDWVILPTVISKEPLGIHVRDGDERWRDITFWVDAALKEAEESGVTKANADEMKTSSKNPFVMRLLGTEGDFGKLLGLDPEWALRAIKADGNYGELYDTYFGPKALGLPRGLNNLWNNGGLHYPLPFR